MSSKPAIERRQTRPGPKRLAGLLLLMIAVLALCVFAYYRYIQARDSVLNQDYYRVLAEAGSTFSENLIKLQSLYDYQESETAIRALFPSYQISKNNPDGSCSDSSNQYWLTQDKMQLRWCHSNKLIEAEIQHTDFLPWPQRGFSQLLFVTADDTVLASTGDETAISFVDLTSVTEALAEQHDTDFFSGITDTAKPPAARLPSYSAHLDMSLSYGEYRVFIYPMRLPTGLLMDGSLDKTTAISQLYIVGLLPKKYLAEQGSGYWNIPLLFATLVSITFVWSVLRMYLQPKNQSVNRLYASFCYIVAYGFFAVLLALIFSYLTVNTWQQSRQQQAISYISQLRADLTRDLHQVFTELRSYREFYQHFLLNEPADDEVLASEKQLRKVYYAQLLTTCPPEDLTYDFYPKAMAVVRDEQCTLSTFYQRTAARDPGLLLSTAALDAAGRSALPSVYYIENNAAPSVYDLSHRDYFKRVRNGLGWQLALAGQQFNNVYIQRLLNINNGTRGTTIAMPLFNGADNDAITDVGLVLVADVVLPSVSLAPPSLNGMQFMVVQRSTGKVLFHSDNSRTFVENVYFMGSENNLLSQTIKAGEPVADSVRTGLAGFYHGQPGKFVLAGGPVDEWALVLFYPQDHVDAIMSNQFLIFSVSMSVFFVVLVSLLLLSRRFINSKLIKNWLAIPLGFDSRRLLLLVSLIWGLVYGFFALRTALQLIVPNLQLAAISFWLNSLLLLLIIGCGWLFLRQRKPQAAKIKPVAKLSITAAVALITLLPFSYLSYINEVPQLALQAHYAKMQCIEFNRERAELHEFALNRFPNSITRQRLQPVQLLPLSWQPDHFQQRCIGVSSSGMPDDYPKLSTIIGNTYLWQWVKTFLVSVEPFEPGSERLQQLQNARLQELHDATIAPVPYTRLLWLTVSFVIPLLLFLLLWQLYVRRVLWLRLGYESNFLRHIHRLSRQALLAPAQRLETGLQLQLTACPPTGVNLMMLVQRMKLADAAGTSARVVLPGFEQLYRQSTVLQRLDAEQAALNISIMLTPAEPGAMMTVTLSQLDTCFDNSQRRRLLLALITEFKALILLRQLSQFNLVMGFNNLQRLTIKDDLAPLTSSMLEQTEYLAWSECLLNFKVQLPAAIAEPLDKEMLQQEIAAYPLLGRLAENRDEVKQSDPVQRPNFWRGNDGLSSGQWATLSYILSHADALYRYKWESCSNEEKLALYNLANGHQLNPLNFLMIEHLALNGLLRVSRGRLTLVNRSFRQFVLNAEPTETLRQLVKVGEAGVWKNYRLSFAVVVVIVVGGIALTSGQSLHIVAASIAGVLGSIISVFSSGNTLRSYFKS